MLVTTPGFFDILLEHSQNIPTKIIWPVGLARRSGPVGNLLTGQKTLTGQIGDGNEVAGVKVGKFRERVHNFASTDQMEATNSAK